MDIIKFEWDSNKNEINKKKHKISFEEAKTVFYDEEALVIDDPEHSQEEERFIILGFSKRANLLVVCHCFRASEAVIRIISARKATKNEENQYSIRACPSFNGQEYCNAVLKSVVDCATADFRMEPAA